MWLGFEKSISLAAFAVSVVISARIVYLLVKKRKWKYPITDSTVYSPPTPLETDQFKRDKVLRRGI